MKNLFKYIILLLACLAIAYFAWRCYDERLSIAQGISAMLSAWHILIIELFLMLTNISLEVVRWRMLYNDRSGSDGVWNSFIIVLKSNALSAATPLGIGEHLVKSYNCNDRKVSLMASLLGSFIQSSVIVLFGIIGLHISGKMDVLYNKVYFIVIITIITLLALIYFFSSIRVFITEYSISRILKIYLINIIKVSIFMLQLYLLLTLSLSITDINLWANVMIYYMVITVIPSAGLADVGIRGSAALAVFGSLVGQQWSGVAALMVWFINRLLPSVFIFLFVLFKDKIIKE